MSDNIKTKITTSTLILVHSHFDTNRGFFSFFASFIIEYLYNGVMDFSMKEQLKLFDTPETKVHSAPLSLIMA